VATATLIQTEARTTRTRRPARCRRLMCLLATAHNHTPPAVPNAPERMARSTRVRTPATANPARRSSAQPASHRVRHRIHARTTSFTPTPWRPGSAKSPPATGRHRVRSLPMTSKALRFTPPHAGRGHLASLPSEAPRLPTSGAEQEHRGEGRWQAVGDLLLRTILRPEGPPPRPCPPVAVISSEPLHDAKERHRPGPAGWPPTLPRAGRSRAARRRRTRSRSTG